MTTKRVTYFVRIDRADGSRTYRGNWALDHCEREAAAWRDSFPDYEVTLWVADRATVLDVHRWDEITENGSRYFPGAGGGPMNDELITYTVTLDTPQGEAQIDVPTHLGPDAAGRRAWASALALGWGDCDTILVANVEVVA